ncbi:heterokaryon incompatibility protein-domain-containing protein [Phaeosphaeriaceae sp. PMI808]|nr:heterokaryon incompatibility protein-domain-containing protein [Phaeosphaeriaceae sp. PMI808]
MAKQQQKVGTMYGQMDDRNRRTIGEQPDIFIVIIKFIACSLYSWILSFISLLSSSQKSVSGTGHTSTAGRLGRPQSRRNYRYRPLKGYLEFRLLELKPGEKKDPLICSLEHFDLSNPISGPDSNYSWPHSLGCRTPSYEAMSYVWGPAPRSEPIRCNGKILNITPSLNNALRRIRKPSDTIRVWADGICIDQSDLRERKMQVDLMRLIFANATMVSIYLGGEVDCPVEDCSVLKAIFQVEWGYKRVKKRPEDIPPSRNLLQSFLPGIRQQYATRRRFSRDRASVPVERGLPELQSTDPTANQLKVFRFDSQSVDATACRPQAWRLPMRLGLRKLTPSALRVIAEFFDNPWFSRIWVVQEVAESKDARVLLGNQEIPWQQVVGLAKRVLREAESRAAILQFSKTKGIHNALVMNNNISIASPDPIPSLLQSTRDFAATDPRDKVYAMLHRPIRKPQRYINVQFLQRKHYLEFFAQGTSLLYLLSVCLDHTLTDIRFWYLMLSLGTVIHHLQFLHRTRSIALDYLQRLADFVMKLNRMVWSRFPVADTIFNMLEIRADYSLTAPSVYRTVATRLIERTRKLNILSYVTHGAAIDTTYPSWVPRWDMPTGGVEVLTAFSNHKYRASSDMEHTLHISSEYADHLTVEGVRFSSISFVSDVISQTWFRKSKQDQPVLDNALAPAFKDQDRRAYIATLTAGRLGHVDREYGTITPGEIQWSTAAALRACYGRRQFVMENRAVGIGPAAMQTGDVVCVLFGGCVPYILRATETDGLYRIVGESYVQGMMQGEVIKEWKAGKFAKQRFTLC